MKSQWSQQTDTRTRSALQRWLTTKCVSPMTNEPMVPWMTRNIALEEMLDKRQKKKSASEAQHKKRPRMSHVVDDDDEVVWRETCEETCDR